MASVTFPNQKDALNLRMGPVKTDPGNYLLPRNPALIEKTNYSYNGAINPIGSSTGSGAASKSSSSSSSSSSRPAPYVEQRVWIPDFNVKRAYDTARKKASGEANTWYKQQLKSFMDIVNYKRSLQQEGYQGNISGLEEALKNTMQSGAVTRGRTLEDTDYNQMRLSEEESNRQLMEANQYDAQKRGLETQLGASGLSTSGLGRQQLQQAGFQRKMGDEAQKRELGDKKREQSNILSRTFEDLATSEGIKTKETELGKRQAKISFDEAMTDLADRERETRINLSQSRAQQQAAMEQSYKINQYLNYFQKLKGYGQQAEASKRYGGFF